MKTFIIIIFPI